MLAIFRRDFERQLSAFVFTALDGVAVEGLDRGRHGVLSQIVG